MVGTTGLEIEREELDSLSLEELNDLLWLVDGSIQAVADAPGREMYEIKLAAGMDTKRSSYLKELDGLTGELQAGKITQATFDKRAHNTIATNFRSAYEANRGAKLDAYDNEYLSRAAADEMKYMRSFGQDIVDDSLKMPRTQRAGMYAQTLDGIAWHAQVEKEPDNARFDWKLGVAEHCPDCIVLAANGPYSKFDLPTTPRAGATVCLSNCKCRLVVTKGRLSKAELADNQEYALRKDQSLSELMEAPAPPAGMRVPSETEQSYIDNLRMQINTSRRTIATAKDSSKIKTAIQTRKNANAELIEFLEKESIYEVPVWSVDDVLDGRHVGRRVVRDIFRHGLDGRSLSLVDKRKLLSMLDRYEKEAGEKFADIAVKPTVSVFDKDRAKILMKELKDGTLSAKGEVELREVIDRLYVDMGMKREPGKMSIVKRDLGSGTSGAYYRQTDLIEISPKFLDDAISFIDGERTKEAIDGIHTIVHEAGHAFNRGSYGKLGLQFSEGGADLVATRAISKNLGVGYVDTMKSSYYKQYIDNMTSKIEGAMRGVGIKNPITREVEDVLTDAFQSHMSGGSSILKWEHMVGDVTKRIKLPPSAIEGLSKEAADKLEAEFREEIKEDFANWVKEEGGKKGFFFDGYRLD